MIVYKILGGRGVYDVVINYDATKLVPAGNVTITNDLINSSYVGSTSFISSKTLVFTSFRTKDKFFDIFSYVSKFIKC